MSPSDTAEGPKIYKSLLPAVPIIRHSVFAYLFETTYYNAHPETSTAYLDFATRQTLTRGDVKRLALELAWGLQNRIRLPDSQPIPQPKLRRSPLKRGDTVMFVSPNSLSWPIALFGCVAAGLRITFASPGSTARELSWQYLDSRPRAIFVANETVGVVKQMLALVGASEEDAHSRIWVMDRLSAVDVVNAQKKGKRSDVGGSGDMRRRGVAPSGVEGFFERHAVRGLEELVGGGALERGERFDGDEAEQTLYVCYSSGTTGRPKGVETTHKNVGTVLNTTHALWSGCESERDVYISIIPTYHIFGLLMLLHYPFMRGKPLVMMNQGFDPQTFSEAVEKYRVTAVCLVPPIILSLSTHPALDNYDLSSITNLTSGAAALSVALANKCLDRLSKRGANAILIQGCGSTETTCPAQIVAPADSVRKFGSVGQLVPNIEARIMVEELSGVVRDAREGEEGEMWMRGPTICKGYFKNPEANASTFTSDGWYKSGDVLRRDEDGYFYIVDRKKEMLKYKGHQIAPAELEAILMENPEVGDVGVIGLKDAYSGDELPRAYVTPSDLTVLRNRQSELEFERRLETWFRGQVSHIKYLRGGVRCMPAIPKSGTGKVLRKDLRELAERERKQERKLVVSRL